MQKLAFLAICFFVTLANANAGGSPVGVNCDLAVPPENAGEETDHGIILRIHPRARDMGHSYSGCQVMWMPDKQGWAVVALVEINAGDPVRIWSPDPSMSVDCSYEGGKVKKGDPQKCPDPRYLILKSLAPGCVAKIQKAIGESGLGAVHPPGCDYE